MDDIINVHEEIDPDDPIESVIRQSLALSEEAHRRRLIGLASYEELQEVKRMEEEGEKLWTKAKELGSPYVSRKNYEDLVIAIFKSAARDYEQLICGSITETPDTSKILIEGLIPKETEIIRDTYHKRFIPYVEKHAYDIAKQWEKFNRQKLDVYDRVVATKYRCPNCHGCLKPMNGVSPVHIGCTGCNLNYYMPGKVSVKRQAYTKGVTL